MNTDYIVQDDSIREKQYKRNINSKGNTRYYDDSCETIHQYAKEQNTIYDPITNQILYGINSNMKVSGVSDGTCNQINPQLLTQRNMCGAGAAGGNRCIKDALLPHKTQIKSKSQLNSLENFASNCNGYNMTELVIFILLVLMLVGMIYLKNNKK